MLRKALSRRLVSPGSYRDIVEADTRPTSFVWAGLGFRWPVASTRSDLDVVARAGARLWQVLGLTSADVLVCGLPLLPTASLQGLQLGALGAGSPALFPGSEPDDIADALRLVPATVLALDSASAAEVIDEVGEFLTSLKLLLLVGAPTDEEREDAEVALEQAGVRAKVRAAHCPDGHRLLWGECAEGGDGLHTYPDLDLVQLVDPETGETGDSAGAGEVVLTQLGLRGTALLRWRTGDVAQRLSHRAVSAVPAHRHPVGGRAAAGTGPRCRAADRPQGCRPASGVGRPARPYRCRRLAHHRRPQRATATPATCSCT